MTHYIPFSRTDVESANLQKNLEWLGADKLLDGLGKLDKDDEFSLLLNFLVEYAGGMEVAEHAMEETLMKQSALLYNAYALSVQKLKARILELYNEKTR